VTTPARDQQPTAIDRRRLVRTGATLAWAVPAISMATVAPAFAVASGCCHLTLSGVGQWRPGDLNYLEVPLTIKNGCSTPVTGLTVVLTVCGINDIQWAGTDKLPSGWTQGGQSNQPVTPDQNGCYKLTYVSAAPLAGNASTTPTFIIKSKGYIGGGKRPAGTVTATVMTPGCTAPAITIDVAQVG
jgi:hypothetical protein